MRVLWLSPWLRTLARVQVQALSDRGHEVLLVTSAQHPESAGARPGELVLDPRPKTASSWPQFGRAVMTTRHFDADVVVAELVRDPRWMLLAARRPRVHVVHDDQPHDASEQRPGWERAVFDRWARSADATVTFSSFVASAVRRSTSHPVAIVPLTSDVDEHLVPPLVEAGGRRDFVVFGRLNPYKNLAVTLAAWQRHIDGPAWRGDELLLIGRGELPGPLPQHARRLDGDFSYADVVPVLAAAKGALVHYRQASQSGVQLAAMQLGVTPIVAPVGALPEFQPPGEPPVEVADVAGLSAALDHLADPAQAAVRGARARAHYLDRFSAAHAASAWEKVLQSLVH